MAIATGTDPSRIASNPLRGPLREPFANPFKGASLDSINSFVKNNFPGHGLDFNHFIVLDEFTLSSDPRTCIIADNTGSEVAIDGLSLVRTQVDANPFQIVLSMQVGESPIEDLLWTATHRSDGICCY